VDRHELAARRSHFEVEQRANGRAVFVADLRDDFVAPIEIVEPQKSVKMIPDASKA
jgi:hypothetical protein